MIKLRDPLELLKEAADREPDQNHWPIRPDDDQMREHLKAPEPLADRQNVTTAIDTPSLTSTTPVKDSPYSNCDTTACGRIFCDGCRECDNARRQAETAAILEAFRRNKQRECGVPLLQRYGNTRRGRWIRVSCKNKRCTDCGPEKRAARVAWFLKETQGRQIYRTVITKQDQWDRLRKQMQRHIEGGGVVVGRRIPALKRGHYVLLWTLPLGEIVEDTATAFDEALRADPMDKRRKVTPVGKRPGGSRSSLAEPKGDTESLWKVEALVTGHRSRILLFNKIDKMGYHPKDLEELPDDILDGFEFVFPLPDEDGYLEVLEAFGAKTADDLRRVVAA